MAKHSGENTRVVAVVVAYNRAELLAETLQGLSAQSRPADAIVVINNASTDNSAVVAARCRVVTEVLTLPENLGGAGGFAAGIARALSRHRADLVWIMDDDTVPGPAALEKMLQCRENYEGEVCITASKAVWTDGREHPMNKPRLRPFVRLEWMRAAQKVGARPIRSASFVSIMFPASAVREHGLPIGAYFLWNDDFEYTSRLLKHQVGLYVPSSIVVHKTKKFGDSSANPGARFVNEVRNKMWMFRYSDSLKPWEKLLYGGKTAMRWALTFKNGPAQVGKYFCQGIGESKHAPRTNAELFAHTPVSEDVATYREYPRKEDAPFSVLMAVYAGDNAQHFEDSLRSISREQIRKPNQIVLVQDGPIFGELQAAVTRASEIARQNVDVVKLDENGGLARALRVGLQHCEHELVARADADDISLPTRFERQIPMMAELDLLGSAITEFETALTKIGITRIMPQFRPEISEVARWRDPFNHPTVVFRKTMVEAAGSYEDCERLEDYWLFARMIQAGARVYNDPTALVYYRVDSGAYNRRGGRELAKAEFNLQVKFYRVGFTNVAQFVRNVVARSLYRFIPTGVRRSIYRGIGSLLWYRRK
ncbi:MAG: glycosyltransferase [Actinomycetaceae bacterium]|nr:glycosyltransferase [Actinomycetaceae bacterium]